MKKEAEIRERLAEIKPKLGSRSDVTEFAVAFSADGLKFLRPLTADETPRARGRAEGWFDALSWVLDQTERLPKKMTLEERIEKARELHRGDL